MARKVTKFVWWAVGTVVLAGIVYAIMWIARPVKTVDGYPLNAVGATDWVEGAKTPSVVLIEYSDFECPYCAEYYAIVKQLPDLYQNQLALVYRNYPLVSAHPNAMAGAQAAEAAGKQGKFWEMHNLLFDNQNTWASMSNTSSTFEGYAQQLGLNMDQYRTDVKSQVIKDRIALQIKSGDAAKVSGTPSFFLNGKAISPAITLDAFKTLIDAAIKNAPLTDTASAPAVHIHADIRVVVDGTSIDFSQDKYQKTADGKDLSQDVHFHNGNGELVHIHKAGITINDLFATFGMSLDRDCLTIDASTTKCATGANKIYLYVNGQPNTSFGDYVFKDLDQILVVYGSDSAAAIQAQIKAVPNNACIYSKTCPQRGAPPPEACAGSETTDCTKA